jgi:DNA-binding NarL/FixJ family response regulator
MSSNEGKAILKVITVDDSPVVVERLESMFRDITNVRFSGHARNISSALHLIQKERPQVVILDIHLEVELPDQNGMNLLITLRKQYPEMKIIMLTNLSEPQYRNTCLAFGADYFFDKSMDFDKISEILKAGF